MNQLPAFAITILCFAAGCFLWQKFVTGRTEWSITNDEIQILWTKKFFFSRSQDLILKWNEIENISRGSDVHYYTLKIKLMSGSTIKFYHDALTTRDDFQNMLKPLYQILNDKKNSVNNLD